MLPTLLLLAAPPALAVPLVLDRFDGAALSADWKVGVPAGATGKGTTSEVAVADGHLSLNATPATRRFQAAWVRVELRGVSWLDVHARVRGGLDGPDRTCGVYVRFEGGPLQAVRPCTPRADWTEERRMLQVPDGVREAQVGVMLTGPGTLDVDDFVVEPATPDWKTLVRDHFEYHWLGADAFSEAHLTTNDEAWTQVAGLLGPGVPDRVRWEKYPDLETLERFTGRRDPSWSEGRTLYTLYRSDVRGLVAVLARAFGRPSPVLVEGAAVYLEGAWQERDYRLVARGQVAEGKAPTLAVLLDPARPFDPDAATDGPLAGAFVAWVVGSHGPEGVHKLLQLDATVGAEAYRAGVAGVLGTSVEAADAAFRAWL